MKHKATNALLITGMALIGALSFTAQDSSALGTLNLLDPTSWDWSNISNPLAGLGRDNSEFPSILHNEITDNNPGSLIIRKVDESGNPLPGAKFAIDGVKAMNIGGKYVYAPTYGDFTEFESNEYGEVVLTNLPYGDYTVRETAAPEGYAPETDPLVVTVSAETMSEQSYRQKRYSLAPNSPNDEAQDTTQGVVLSAGGSSYLALSSSYGYGEDEQYIAEATYDPEIGGYDMSSSDGFIIKKQGDAYDIDIGTNHILAATSSPQNYTTSLKFSDVARGAYPATLGKDSDNPNILIMDASSFANLSGRFIYDEASGCFNREDDPSSEQFICEEHGKYIFYVNTERTRFMPFTYDENQGKYIFDNYYLFFRIVEIDETTIGVAYGYQILYEPEFERSSIWWMTQWLMNTNVQDATIDATNIIVANTPVSEEEGNAAENSDNITPNPKTSDTLIKVLSISTIALLPAFAIRKRLTRR